MNYKDFLLGFFAYLFLQTIGWMDLVANLIRSLGNQ